MPGVSVGVVIPTYQRVELTVHAVSSVMEQTRLPDQVVVVDDGSPVEVLSALRKRLASWHVDVLSTEHTAHPGRVRNAGIARLSTTHVAFLDSDDSWDPRFLEAAVREVEHGARAVFSGYVACAPGESTGERVVLPSRRVYGLHHLLARNPICNSSVVVEREILDGVGWVTAGYPLRGVEDYATWLRVAVLTDWTGIPQPLVRYLDDPTQSIRGTRDSSVPETLVAHLDLIDWLQQTGRRPPLTTLLAHRVVAASLGLWALRRRR